jgi:hypothetical protein
LGGCLHRVFFEKLQNQRKILDFFFVLTKNGLGCILGDFFTNSSGHPGSKEPHFDSEQKFFLIGGTAAAKKWRKMLGGNKIF